MVVTFELWIWFNRWFYKYEEQIQADSSGFNQIVFYLHIKNKNIVLFYET